MFTNTINRSGVLLTAASLVAAAAFAPLLASADTAPTFATVQTVANVNQVKATRTITVNSAPTVPVTLTIGTCAISITGVVSSDVDCSNNTAAIATSTDTSAALIAARIRTITGLSDTGHGALTVGGTGSTASFTTTGTETAATAITATLSSGSDVTLTTVNTSGTIPVAQAVTFTPADIGNTDVFTVTVNGTSYSSTIAIDSTPKSLVEDLVAQLAATIALSCSENDVTITCTAASAGTPFTYSTNVTDNEVGSSHHGSGGGGGSSSHSKTSSVTSTVDAGTTTTTTSTTAGMIMTGSSDLTIGSTGADVTALQTWLIGKGFSIPAGATGYFGAQTKAALAAYQAANMISPAAGYFGPITRAYIAAH